MTENPRDTWSTPDWLVSQTAAMYGHGGFRLDVAASPINAKATRFYDLNRNGLLLPWDDFWLCNPPYSSVSPWVDHALLEVPSRRAPGVLILPSRTDRKWYHDLRSSPLTRIIELPYRVQFDPPPGIEPSTNREPTIVVQVFPPIVRATQRRRHVQPQV